MLNWKTSRKQADLFMLAENPLTIAPMKIKEIEVLKTTKDGVVVRER
jgi:predicted amidohydrolase YtcJ